jgi:hypothetical protein
MEIIPVFKNYEKDPFELNNKIIKQYGALQMISYDVFIKKEKKFIASFYYNDVLLLRAIYSIMGSFSKEKNVWFWANRSITLNEPMKNELVRLRTNLVNLLSNKTNNSREETLLNEKIKKFVQSDYSILSTDEACNILSLLSLIITADDFFEMNGYSILTIERNSIVEVLIIKKVLTNNMK